MKPDMRNKLNKEMIYDMDNNRKEEMRFYNVGSRTYVLRNVLVLMMMMIGANVWGQQTGPVGTDYSGTYYIANYNDNNYNSVDNTNNFYLCPASNYFDGDGEGKKKQRM